MVVGSLRTDALCAKRNRRTLTVDIPGGATPNREAIKLLPQLGR